MIEQRILNYLEYYDKVEPIKRYSLEELMDMDEMTLLNLMPQNQCVDEYSQSFGYSVTKYIVTFQIYKIIDGTWNIGYHEGHRDKTLKEQFTLFELSYVKNLKVGLIDLFLKVQNRSIEYFNNVKLGIVKLNLSNSWDDREKLGLPKLEIK